MFVYNIEFIKKYLYLSDRYMLIKGQKVAAKLPDND